MLRSGLTAEQRARQPWGLSPALLGPGKVITDPVHGDIGTSILEQAIIDTPPFQRLRRVRQLGTAHLVYPGGTHTRFSHSLGALCVVQDLLDRAISQSQALHAVPDLILQWRGTPGASGGPAEDNIAEAIVAARLGALLHDLGHVPFGHSIEDDLGILVKHDANIERFRRAWNEIAELVGQRVANELGADAARTLDTLFQRDGALLAEILPLIVSRKSDAYKPPSIDRRKYPFVADLVGNTICADLLDYLLRDHMFTGLPASLGMRFASAFFIVPEGRGPYSKRLAVSIFRSGHERTDVVSELLKALRYRYELQERVIVHHAKLAGDAMVGKTLELVEETLWLTEAEPLVQQLANGRELLEDANHAQLRGYVRQSDPRGARAVSRRVRVTLERLLLTHGDDGLMEVIAALDAPSAEDPPDGMAIPAITAARRRAAGLARAYQNRDLFKLAGRVGTSTAPAQELFRRYGARDARAALQDDAQRFAELGAEPQLMIWLPDPDMRLKLAEVLVDDGDHVDTFVNYERARGRRGSDIYDAHMRLWSLSVFVSPATEPFAVRIALAYLAARLGVCWEHFEDDLGGRPAEWVDRLALSQMLGIAPRDPDMDALLGAAASASARGATTFRDRREYLATLPLVRAALAPRGQ